MKVIAKLRAVFTAIHASGHLPKEGNNREQNYKYLSEKQVKELIQPILVEHGLLLVPIRQRIVSTGTSPKGTQRLTDVEVTVHWIDADSGEFLECTYVATGADSNDKGVYKALTGGGKQFICNTFWIPTGDDPERDGGVSADKPRVQSQGRKQSPNDKITEAQTKRIFGLANASGVALDRVRQIIGNHGYESSKDILAKDYDAICEEISGGNA